MAAIGHQREGVELRSPEVSNRRTRQSTPHFSTNGLTVAAGHDAFAFVARDDHRIQCLGMHRLQPPVEEHRLIVTPESHGSGRTSRGRSPPA